MPSMRPTTSMLVPRTVTMNTGSRLWISSDDTSISRLTKPRAQIPAGRREGDAGAAFMRGRSGDQHGRSAAPRHDGADLVDGLAGVAQHARGRPGHRGIEHDDH